MALHELATNAMKYGALSTATGSVEVSWVIDGPEPGRLRIAGRRTAARLLPRRAAGGSARV
jgi:two-component sensor histidine kinase